MATLLLMLFYSVNTWLCRLKLLTESRCTSTKTQIQIWKWLRQLLYPASTLYTTGQCCCFYLWQTRNHHNCQLKLVKERGSLRKPQEDIQQDCQETIWWEHDEHSNNWIDEYIGSELEIVNYKASFTVTFMLGAHSRNDNSYGVFKVSNGNVWFSSKGTTTNSILRCPLWKFTVKEVRLLNCPCKAKNCQKL